MGGSFPNSNSNIYLPNSGFHLWDKSFLMREGHVISDFSSVFSSLTSSATSSSIFISFEYRCVLSGSAVS